MFSGIKVGDIVIVHTWTSGLTDTRHKYRLGRVIKVNKKTFKVNISNKTFTIDGGSVYGGYGLERINIMKYDAELYEQKILEQKQEEFRMDLLSKVRNINYDRLTTEQLKRIVMIADENKPQ